MASFDIADMRRRETVSVGDYLAQLVQSCSSPVDSSVKFAGRCPPNLVELGLIMSSILRPYYAGGYFIGKERYDFRV